MPLQTPSKIKPSILIIDDDKNILKILSKLLEKAGYIVTTAETGQEALYKIKNQNYNVALVDVNLQDINGLNLLNQIHKIAPDMVKIILTGYPSDENRTRALELGASDYLTKPVKPEKLIEAIQSKVKKNST
ncbi:MAG: response regulator [Candidatus Bathyarchaeia archaeon]